MTEKLEALVRTLTPVAGGALIGLMAYFALMFIPSDILALILAVGVFVFIMLALYQMNLDTVRNNRSKRL